jgi:hypothetical protein
MSVPEVRHPKDKRAAELTALRYTDQSKELIDKTSDD